ncbi:hypothetical protein GGI12_005327 [Dipsacomyces acuminosporus]|nr:hypothetical protein GGI12_005327 [Dipsacomyces acuminosporus]
MSENEAKLDAEPLLEETQHMAQQQSADAQIGSKKPESIEDAIAKAATNRRFQRRPLTQQFLQEDYEQNMLGTTAGFFCAIWAGWLLGEPVSSLFTSFSYQDVDLDGYYYFGGKDISLSVMLAIKTLFVRAGLFRYVIRTVLQALGVHPFERRQKLAEQVYLMLSLSVSVVASAYFILPLRASGLAHLWDGYPVASVPLASKLFVIFECSYRLSELIALYFEGEKRVDYYDQALLYYFVLGIVGCSSLLGMVELVGIVLLCTDLPRLITAAADACQILSLALYKPLLGAAAAASGVISVAILPHLLYVVASASPSVSTDKNTAKDGAVWTAGMRTAFISTFVVIIALGLRYTASLVSELVSRPSSPVATDGKDAKAGKGQGDGAETKKTQ